MKQLNNKSTWKTGQRVTGNYHGVQFSGLLNEQTRVCTASHDVLFCVTLDCPITVYQTTRNMIQIGARDMGAQIYTS